MTNQVIKLKNHYTDWLAQASQQHEADYGLDVLVCNMQGIITLCDFFIAGVPTSLISDPISQYMILSKVEVLCKRCRQHLSVECGGCLVKDVRKKIDRVQTCIKMLGYICKVV